MRTVFFSFILLTGLVGSLGFAAGGQQSAGGQQAQPATAAAPAKVETPPAAPSLDGALGLYRARKFSEAAEMYNALIAADPKSAPAYAGLARADLKLGKLGDANAAATKAIDCAPNSADAHVALGEVLFRQGKIPEAEKEFVSMVKAGTGDARAYLGMARVSRLSSYYKQAKVMIDEAHALDGKDPDIISEWIRSFTYQTRSESSMQPFVIQTDDKDKDAKKDADQDDEKSGDTSSAKAGETAVNKDSDEKTPEFTTVVQNLAGASGKSCRMISHTTAAQLPLAPIMSGAATYRGYGLNVKVNGASAKLIVDTGSSGIVIDRRIAEKAKIARVVKSGVGGVGDKGEAAGYIGKAESVKVGDLEFQDCFVQVVEQNGITGDDGLIGTDVFSEFLVELDFPHEKMKVSELPAIPGQAAASAAGDAKTADSTRLTNRYVAPEMKSYTPLYRVGHVLLLPTRINDGTLRLFLLDTGASHTSISPDVARESTKVYFDQNSKVKGLSGTVKDVYTSDRVVLTFADMRQESEDLLSFDTSGFSAYTGTDVAGILGFVTLYRLDIKIDYRDGLVKFEFDKKRWEGGR